ncbi:hypothetical protein KORDIASMS9_02684 [Kordia sp. SMS9]|uniref:phage portal protein family protein n=1 Tax=Kordia sp. SMS9 TaxID=2282170 RepID=UPI000E0DD9EB|nr:DUF935 family protein [Kordia sp. SMS9]AXG70444.1 hypothetical protein KORDIASMS9_02684 [Kordia sp. SMS9]
MTIPHKERYARIGRKLPKAIQSSRSTGKGREIENMKNIVDQIVNQFKDRSRKNIKKWRNSLLLADLPEKPRLTAYHDLLDDLMTDGHLISQMELRENSTLNAEFEIRNQQGKINEEGTKLFRQSWFYKFMKEALLRILRGTKIIEFESFNGNKIKINTIPQRNAVPTLKTIFPDLSKEDGIRYDDPYYENWVIQIGEDKELGILNNIVPNLIWKRNVAQSWAEFCERFGLPMITATTNSTDPKIIDNIDYMLSKIAQASRGVFPKGTEIEFKEANRTDAYQVYDKFIERNNNEISEAIVGGTMLTNNGSSRSQSEVHERNLDKRLAVADKRFIMFLVNDELIPLLINQGYKELKEGDVFVFPKGLDLDLDKFWKIVQGISKEYEVEQEWITKTFGVPILGKKKSQSQQPNKVVSSYLNMYPISKCCPSGITAASKSFTRLINQYYNELLDLLWNKKNTLSATAKIHALEAKELISGLHKGWTGRTSVAYNTPDHLAMRMMEFNLIEFAASKTEARLASLSELLVDKEKFNIRSFSDFKAEAEKVTEDFNKTYLETEYNLSVATAQGAAQQIRFLEEKDTVTNLVMYQTAGDSKVRSEHQALDGLVFDLNDDETLDIWTPNGYGCRCEFLQHFQDNNTVVSKASTAKNLLGDKFKKSPFNSNRLKSQKVFTEDQYYTDTNKIAAKLNKMSFDKVYNLDSYSVFKQRLNSLKLDASITKDNIKELFNGDGKSNGSDFMGFSDYLKRKVILKKSVFDGNTKSNYTKKNELRHQLFPHLKSVLTSPDEVWIYGYDKKAATFLTRYISFYNNHAIVVQLGLGDIHIEIKGWQLLKDEKSKRKGLLLYNSNK